MATTQDTYTGDNSTTTYNITFDWIVTTDIKVSLDGVDQTLTTDYALINNNTQVEFVTAPGQDVAIRIYRDTDSDELSATFFAGSSLRAADLNNNFKQTLYSVQEVVSRFIDRTNAVFENIIDMGGFRITNLADGTADGDAVNKSQLDASQTYNDAQLTDAVDDAQAAVTQAQTARNQAQTAQAAAEDAQDAAEAAQTAAETAETNAETAEANAAASAAAAASFAGSTVFFGFRRDANHHLLLDYSITTEADTYATGDYEYKNGSQWYIGSNDILHQTGPNLGEPRFAFDDNGHLILSDT